MGRKRSRTIFENHDNEYVARNGHIDEYGLSVLEDRYIDTGIIFENDEFNDEANMSWPSFIDKAVLAEAKLDFENFISRA